MAYFDLKKIKPRELPKNGEKIIALLYIRWIDTDAETEERLDTDDFISIAYGVPKPGGNGEYIFSFKWGNDPFEEVLSANGYKKDESVSKSVFRTGDNVKESKETMIIDYEEFKTAVSLSFMDGMLEYRGG